MRLLGFTLTSLLMLAILIPAISLAVALSSPVNPANDVDVAYEKRDYSIYDVRLVTGDVVKVRFDSEGNMEVVSIKVHDPKALNRAFMVFKWRDGLYVIPTDVDLNKVDLELFNVKRLIDEGYDLNGSIPLIIAINGYYHNIDVKARVHSLIDALDLGKVKRDFKIVPASSLDVLPSVKFYELISSPYVSKVWLDRKVKVSLADSIPLINATALWDLGYNGSGVRIAILDTGIDSTHPDFYFPNGTSKIEVEVDFTDDNTVMDLHGHGTHVASIAAGTGAASNGTYTGVAPGALLWNVKVVNQYGYGYDSWVISGIEYAAYGPDGKPNTGDEADIINLSLGASEYTDGTDPLSLACDAAVDAGVIVVVAAGNDGDYFTIGTPAASRKAVTVGASTKQDEIAWFSSRGPTIDLRIKPDVVAPGEDIIAARSSSGIFSPIETNEYYTQLSGTSMATPHVAGLAALLKQAYPDLTPEQFKNLVISTAVDLGYDVYAQGGGRVNALSALMTKLIVEPAAISLGRLKPNETYYFNITFSNLNISNVTITVTPRLERAWYDDNYSEALKLNATVVTIPPNSSCTIRIELNTSNIPTGLYSGMILTNYSIGGSYVHAIFGFSLERKVRVKFLGLDGQPLPYKSISIVNATDGTLVADNNTDANGECIFYLMDGTYYVVGWDVGSPYYAVGYAILLVNISSDMNITLDMRNACKVSYEPSIPNQLIAWLDTGLDFERYGMKTWLYYPEKYDIYVSPSNVVFYAYYQHYDKSYANPQDPSLLLAPSLYSVIYCTENVSGNVTITTMSGQLYHVKKELRTALIDRVGARYSRDADIYRKIVFDDYYLLDYITMASGYEWDVIAPRSLDEYLSYVAEGNLTVIFGSSYRKTADVPNTASPYFYFTSYEAYYDSNESYNVEMNSHPLDPDIEVSIWKSYDGNTSLSVYTDVFGDSWPPAFGLCWSDEGRLIIKVNGSIIYDSGLFDDFESYYLSDLQLPAEIEIEVYGNSTLDFSSTAIAWIAFNATPDVDLWFSDPMYIRVEGLDLRNIHPGGDVIGQIMSYHNLTISSLKYSFDGGATWSDAEVYKVGFDTYEFKITNALEGYLSLMVNATMVEDNVTVYLSYKVLRAIYVSQAAYYNYTISVVGVPVPVTVYLDGEPVANLSGGESCTLRLYGEHSVSVDPIVMLDKDVRCICENSSINISSAGNFTFIFKTQYYVNITASPSYAGSVSPSSGWYDANSTLTLMAVPRSGYAFIEWTGSGSGSYNGTKNPISIIAQGPINETAIFKALDLYNITINATSLTVESGVLKALFNVSANDTIISVCYVIDDGVLKQLEPLDGSFNESVEVARLEVNCLNLSEGYHKLRVITETAGGAVKETTLTIFVKELAPRYNLISLAVKPLSELKASDIVKAIGGAINGIWRFNVVTQEFDAYIPGFSGPEDDFTLTLGEGYFVYLTDYTKLVEVGLP